MDQSEEQLDYEDEDRRLQAFTEAEETIPEEDEYEDLYHDVNVGFIAPLVLDLDPSPAPENLTAVAKTPSPDQPKDYAPENQTAVAKLPSRRQPRDYAPETQTAVAKSPLPDQLKDYGEANDGRQGSGTLTQRSGRETNTGPAGTPASAATSTPNQKGNYHYAGRDSGENGGGGRLIVYDLQWWTTDAELEASLSEYGRVESIEFKEEMASGKSRGVCEVQFYDYGCARACKEGMNGRVFNGKPCVVEFTNSRTYREMMKGMRRGVNHQDSQSRRMMNDSGGNHQDSQSRRMMNDSGGGRGGGGGEGGRGRHYVQSSRGPGGYGGQGRGQGGPGRGRAGKGTGLGPGNVSGGGQYGQAYFGSIGGGAMPPMMRNQGFDLSFGAQMGSGGGGGGGYVGFAAHASNAPPHFPAMVQSFSPAGSVGLAGVAPHVNPAFFGQGMSGNGMGVIPSGSGMEGYHAGMWTDSGWGRDGHSRRMGESGYGDYAGSEYAYAEKNHERGGRSNFQRNRDRSTENDLMGTSVKRHRNDREADWNGGRDRYREKERDGHQDQRDRERNWESERPSRSKGKSHDMEEADQHAFSREAEYTKRRY